jgi:hypothetical protein
MLIKYANLNITNIPKILGMLFKNWKYSFPVVVVGISLVYLFGFGVPRTFCSIRYVYGYR